MLAGATLGGIASAVPVSDVSSSTCRRDTHSITSRRFTTTASCRTAAPLSSLRFLPEDYPERSLLRSRVSFSCAVDGI